MSTGARTNVGDNSLSLMRATLRAPPSKWAIEAFFRRVSAANRGRGQPRRGYRRPKPTARSDVGRLRSRRAACFLWYFLSRRKKVLSPSGRQPHRPRRSRRVNPPAGELYHEAIRSFSCARPPRGGSPTIRAGVGASIPRQGSRIMRQSGAFHASRPLRAAALPFPPGQWVCACGRTKGLSSGQTIGAVRTAVRSACCLPELRVANRLRRLYPLDTRFPSFPFGNLRASKPAKNPWKLHPLHSWQNGRTPPKARCFPRGKQSACRALRLLVA